LDYLIKKSRLTFKQHQQQPTDETVE